ncbi:hypothetical protein EMIT093MI4_290003 [Pseudomonas sp. IT-93MI4]
MFRTYGMKQTCKGNIVELIYLMAVVSKFTPTRNLCRARNL